MFNVLEEKQEYKVVNLNDESVRFFDNEEDFLVWLARKTLIRYYNKYNNAYYKTNYDDFNFSGDDTIRDVHYTKSCNDTKSYNDNILKERKLYCIGNDLYSEVCYYLRTFVVYYNGVLFDVRQYEKDLLGIYALHPDWFYSSYEKWRRNQKDNAKRGDVHMVRHWHDGAKICYAFRKDPVPYIHHRKGRSLGRGRVGHILRMVNTEEYQEYGRPGRYSKRCWDYKNNYRSYAGICWKDCTKKRKQWEK